MTRHSASPARCPVCGAAVPAAAKSCRECGADERAGWNEDATRYDGLDLPEEAFEDDDTLRTENSKPRDPRKAASVFRWAVGVILLVIMVTLAVGF